MRRQRAGVVRRGDPWISVEAAASQVEWPRAQMADAIAFGIVPAVRLRSGETMVLEAAVRGLDRRLTEHD